MTSNPNVRAEPPTVQVRPSSLWRVVLVDVAIALCVLIALEGFGRWADGDLIPKLHPPPDQVRGDGLRGMERPAAKEHGGVVAIGDSTTFGVGVPWDAAYPAALERSLTQIGQAMPVLNAGGKGSSIQYALWFTRERLAQYQARVMVIGLSPPMVASEARRLRGPGSSAPAGTPAAAAGAKKKKQAIAWRRLPLAAHVWVHKNTFAYPLVDRYVRMNMYRLGVMNERLDKTSGAMFAYAFDVPSVSPTQYKEVEGAYASIERGIGELHAALKKADVKLVLMALPSRFMISESPADNLRNVRTHLARIRPCERFRAIAQRTAAPFVDLCRALKDRRAKMVRGDEPWHDLFVVDDFTHLDAEGNRIAGNLLAATIARLSVAPPVAPEN